MGCGSSMAKRPTTVLMIGLGTIALLAFAWLHRSAAAPPNRAFYYWKTEWHASPEILESLNQNHIGRLYMRFFDVEWDEVENAPRPVSPLRFRTSTPAGVDVVPVVYIVNAVFLKMPYKDVEALADHVLNKVNGMAEEQGLTFRQVQLDCDWSDSTRRSYFHFVDLIGRKLKDKSKIVSSTIRLHQIKYASRTGVPPASRGMLMFYNFGRIQADSPKSSIFNPEDAGRYASYISAYPLQLDVVLPAFSWIVHSREGRVMGLLENIGEDEVASFDGFRKTSSNRYEASRSFFFRGRYFMTGDLLLMETTTPEITKQAAVLARRGAGSKKTYGTVALFDLDEKHLKHYRRSAIESILEEF
jgi:hypothetical protein